MSRTITIETKLTRRQLIQAAALLTPIAVTARAAATQNDDFLLLRADDPVARALLYYPSSKNVPDDHPLAARHQREQTCASCVHVRDDAGNGTRKCPTFPGRLVNAEGWCSLWAKG